LNIFTAVCVYHICDCQTCGNVPVKLMRNQSVISSRQRLTRWMKSLRVIHHHCCWLQLQLNRSSAVSRCLQTLLPPPQNWRI